MRATLARSVEIGVFVVALSLASGSELFAQKVGIESGHLGRTVGALGAVCPNGIREVDVAKSVSDKVASTLRRDGYTVNVLTGVLMKGGKQDPKGIWVHRGYSAAVFVSLHLDVCNTKAVGFKVARWKGYKADGTDGSGDASDRLVSAIWREYGLITRQKKHTSTITNAMRLYYGLGPTSGISPSTPGAILELAFLSEYGLTGSQAGHWKMAYGVVNAITAFFDAADKPTVTTSAAKDVESTTATLTGLVNPNGLSTKVFFQWGLTAAYGKTTAQQDKGSGTAQVGVTAAIAGLAPDTTYHARLVGTNAHGTTNGQDITFKTKAGAGPGAFTLTGAIPECIGSLRQIRLTWTPSSGVTTYAVYRNESAYVSGLSAATLTFRNTGSNITPGVTYTYFIRAKSAAGYRDSNTLQATAPNCS